MSTVKTTVYLNASDYRRLKSLAAAEGRSAADLIRVAVAEYTERRGAPAFPSSIGAGSSGTGDLAARDEELLDGLGSS